MDSCGCGRELQLHVLNLKERDIETGLDYFLARHYSSSQGRFVSVDPITITSYRLANPQALNGYSYVMNSPLKFTDPTGREIHFRNQAEADQALKTYQSGLTKDQQKYLSIDKNKNGTYYLKVDEKAGKSADKFSLLGRLYGAASATQVAIVSFVKKDDTISFRVATPDGKVTTGSTTFNAGKVAGLTLLPLESREKAQPKNWGPVGYSMLPNKTQILVATDDSRYTPTQAIYAETLAHFGEFVRTGNPVAATHYSSTVTTIEDDVVGEAGANEKRNRQSAPNKKPD